MKQRLLSVLLILCLLMGTVPQLVPTASAATYSGTCGDNLTWTLDTETGVLRISGTGNMANWSDFGSGVAPWYSHRSYVQSVVIAFGVTSIGNSAFYDCTALTSVTIPNSVTAIGSCAFRSCTGLTSISIPNGVTSIRDRTFSGCTALTSVHLPDSVRYIGMLSFSECTSLTSVNIPNGVITIDFEVFRGCTALTSVHIPYSVISIDDSVFVDCTSLTSVTIPSSVIEIYSNIFSGCTALTSVTIPNSVSSIGGGTFFDCTALSTVTIPASVINIGKKAFYGCTGLEKLYVLNPSCNIFDEQNTFSLSETGAIYGYPGSTAEKYAQKYGYTFHTLSCNCDITSHNHKTKFASPTCVQTGGYSLVCEDCDCSYLISTAPLTGTHNYETTYFCASICGQDGISTYTCADCGDTKTRTTPAPAETHSYEVIFTDAPTCGQYGVTAYTCTICGAEKNESISATENHSYEVTSTVAPTCTQDGETVYTCTICGAEKNESIPATESHSYEVTSTVAPTCTQDGETVYTCTICGAEKNESIPATENHSYEVTSTVAPACTQDGETVYTCADCGATKTESVPATGHSHLLYRNNGTDHSVTCENCPDSYIEAHSFEDDICVCGAKNAVTYSGTCGNKLTWTLDISTGVLHISGTGDMTNMSYYIPGITPWYNHRAHIQSVEIASGVTSIGSYAFERCTALISVTIPDTVTFIGYSVFSDCTKLQSIQVDTENQHFSSDAHGVLYNKNRTELIACPAKYSGSYVIPNGVVSIKSDAFINCSGLTAVTIPDSVTSIGNQAFHGCTGLTAVRIPDSVTSLGGWVFEDCTNLTSVTLPADIDGIPGNTFENCTVLTSVNIPENATYIGDSAFEDCAALKSITVPDGVTHIGWYAFSGCTALESITIPDSFIYINVGAFSNTAYYNNESNWDQEILYIGRHLIDAKYNLKGSRIIREGTIAIHDEAFSSCTGLTSVTIPDSVVYIGEQAFYCCDQLVSANIPKSLTSLGAEVFAWTGLRSLIIPSNITYIGGGTFRECFNLTELYILNPACEITDSLCYTMYPEMYGEIKITIYGHSGTAAETVAKNSGHTFYAFPCNCEADVCKCVIKTVEPSCESRGGTYVICNSCGGSCTISVSSAAGHRYDNGSVTTPATCTSDGVRTYTCTACEVTIEVPISAIGHNYETTSVAAPSCVWTGLNQYACTVCGHTKSEVVPATGHSYDDGAITTPPTCISKGIRTYTCTVCGNTKVESIPVTEHQHLLYRNNGDDHSVKCITCPNSYNEPHRFVEGRCVCGAVERILDETIRIYHSLNLASDIAVNYAVKAAELEGYESYYMECILPIYDGNTLLGTEAVRLQPELQGDFYYFTLNGLTALEMNNMVEATLHMTKDGKHYISNTDSYSIATYAYAQLNNEAMPEALRILCANLLRYGAKAQLWKGYRTDALADGAMTEAHKELLKDLDSVEFGYNSQILTDIENPVITWVGKTMRLDSKIVVRFVMNTTNYTGDVENLSLRVSFVNINGDTETATLTNCVVYNAERNYYAFDFDGLLSAELRCVLNAAVYEGDTQLSPTMVYSVDTYGTSTTGDLRTLVQGMIAYGDSAKDFFAN